jgi:hypothetical protein
MPTTVVIEAGVCGLQTAATAAAAGERVRVTIDSDCPKASDLGEAIAAAGGVDVLAELGAAGGPLGTAQMGSCCAGCVVPAGILKACQVAAGLALPGDAAIRFRDGPERG